MKIVINDAVSGKRFLIKGHDVEWMIYQHQEGELVDGVRMTKNGKVMKNPWTFTGYYPTTLDSAVAKCVNMCLASDDDSVEMVTDAAKAGKAVAKVLRDRVAEITAEVLK